MLSFGREQIPQLQDKVADLKKRIEKVKENLRGLIKHGKEFEQKIVPYHANRIEANTKKSQDILNGIEVHRYASWEGASQWEAWAPLMWDANGANSQNGQAFTPNSIRIGELIEKRNNTVFSVPAMMPFIGHDRTVIIQTSGADYAQGLSLLQSLLVRTALMLPYQTTYTLLDPAHLGQAFPMRNSLPAVQNSTNDVRRDLDQVTDRIVRLNTSFLEHEAFHEVDLDLRINERFHFVFAADFPNRYDHRAIEALERIAETGPRAGTYLFIHHNTDHALPRDVTMGIFRNAFHIDMGKSVNMNGFALRYDAMPTRELQTSLFRKLSDAKPPERKIDWEDVVGLDEANWWRATSDTLISTPLGAVGTTGRLDIWLGESSDRGIVSHGVLGGATGSGKSYLYHAFILGLAIRYSPSELRFFLIDGKDGVEFQPYRNLPHAEVVSLKSSPQLSRNVLLELTQEMERRNEIFSNVGVVNLTQYREREQPSGKLPRILLLVDEYQELFEGDKDMQASMYLEQIARQGRSVGIHMLLGAQGFVGIQGMLNRNAIFGNIQLRMAMKMPGGDVQTLTEFQRQGKQLIMACDLPGKIVVNHQSGNDGENANQLGKVAYLKPDVRTQVIEKLKLKVDNEMSLEDNPITIVFDGKAQPNFIENQLVEYLLQQESWIEATDMEKVARRPLHANGFNIPDWFAAEHPSIAWIGQDFSVRGQAGIVFRRRVAENALVIGSNDAVRYGILGMMVTSIALNAPPNDSKFYILDRSRLGSDWSQTLSRVCESLLKPNQYEYRLFKESRDAETMLDLALQALIERREMNEEALIYEPNIFCFMTDLENVDDLRRPAGTYTMGESRLGDKLNRLLVEGPSRGIHVIMSFSNVKSMQYVVDERHALQNFRHRIALQMSEDESLTYVRSRRAATLQSEGSLPIVGLYLDTENDKNLRFKPYSLQSTVDYYDQIRQVSDRIATWSTTNEHG